MSIGNIFQCGCHVRVLDHFDPFGNVLIPCHRKDSLCTLDACCKMIQSNGMNVHCFLDQEFVYCGFWTALWFVSSITILTNGGVYAAAGVSNKLSSLNL